MAKVNLLFYTINPNGSITLHDTISDCQMTYYFSSLKEAVRIHRLRFGLQRKRLKLVEV